MSMKAVGYETGTSENLFKGTLIAQKHKYLSASMAWFSKYLDTSFSTVSQGNAICSFWKFYLRNAPQSLCLLCCWKRMIITCSFWICMVHANKVINVIIYPWCKSRAFLQLIQLVIFFQEWVLMRIKVSLWICQISPLQCSMTVACWKCFLSPLRSTTRITTTWDQAGSADPYFTSNSFSTETKEQHWLNALLTLSYWITLLMQRSI